MNSQSLNPVPADGVVSLVYPVAPPMQEVRWAVLGLGARGSFHVDTLLKLNHSRVTALSDPHDESIATNADKVRDQSGQKPFTALTGEDGQGWRAVLEREDVDAVVIASPWELHTPMAVAAMQAGKHAFIEVPAAMTVEECWQLVDTSEKTGMHCMMLENCNYGREEMLLLNMCSQGLLGDLLHAEAAYIHELREQMQPDTSAYCAWRTRHVANLTGNLYPTHGVGPVAHCLNVNRGDNFDYLVSMSSPARGRKVYAEAHIPPEHEWNQVGEWQSGDTNTSIIKLNSGKTLMVQWDETTPRPYSSHNYLHGTKGAFGGFPDRIALDYALEELPEAVRQAVPQKEARTNYHEWDTTMAHWYEAYDHPLWKKIGADAELHGGHGGMDYIMFWRVEQCLINGWPMDQSVYDAALWSSILPLSMASVQQGSAPQKFPDFTRGKWRSTPPVSINVE